MKDQILLFLFSLLFTANLASQAPQTFSYQGLATDENGLELSNQTLSIRASILSNAIDGPSEWIEIHQVTTDPFGLFVINIGEGDPSGGLQTVFSTIDWSANTHFLKIEMDADGGNSFNFMGTNQLLSVPYAIHAKQAENAKIADNAVLAETAMTTAFADSSGISNQALTAGYADSTAIAGTAQSATFSDSSAVAEMANTANFATTASTALTAGYAVNSDTAQYALYSDTAQYSNLAFIANSAMNAQNAAFAQVAFTAVDDSDKDPENELQQLELSEDTIKISNGNFITLTEAGLLDPYTSIEFPQGDNYTYTFIEDAFTVPGGMNLYLTAAPDSIQIPGVGGGTGALFTGLNMPVLPPGTQVNNCKCLGFLTESDPDITPLVAVLNSNGSNFFQVPAFKQFVIKSGINDTVPISVNNVEINLSSGANKAIVIPSGMRIKNESNEDIIITGYLKTIE